LIVIDASALTEYLLGRARAVEVLAQERAPLHAPDLVELETLNALRALVRRRAVTEPRASQAVVALGQARVVRYPHASLRSRVWALRDQLSAYDAAYLALAEMLPGSTLFTADAGLAVRGRDSLGDERVRLIE
jgi:predicted nucleic acid-binding protein